MILYAPSQCSFFNANKFVHFEIVSETETEAFQITHLPYRHRYHCLRTISAINRRHLRGEAPVEE